MGRDNEGTTGPAGLDAQGASIGAVNCRNFSSSRLKDSWSGNTLQSVLAGDDHQRQVSVGCTGLNTTRLHPGHDGSASRLQHRIKDAVGGTGN
jgi:hypothetical protein